MANSFLHNEEGVATNVSDLRDALDSYETNVDSLENFITSIKDSDAWIDEDVKTSFLAAAQGYIAAYRIFTTGIEGYIDCLEQKSKNISLHESNFSK